MKLLSCLRAPDAKRVLPPATVVASRSSPLTCEAGAAPRQLSLGGQVRMLDRRFFGRDSLAWRMRADRNGVASACGGACRGGGSMPRRQGLARAPHLSERRRNLAEGLPPNPGPPWPRNGTRCGTSTVAQV